MSGVALGKRLSYGWWCQLSLLILLTANRAKDDVEKPLVFDQGSRLLIEDVGFHQVFTKRWAQTLHVMFHEQVLGGD
jgi:hypothetical protein